MFASDIFSIISSGNIALIFLNDFQIKYINYILNLLKFFLIHLYFQDKSQQFLESKHSSIFYRLIFHQNQKLLLYFH